MTGKWTGDDVGFGYDYWYQPKHNVMISTSWGAPSAIKTGFNLDHVKEGFAPLSSSLYSFDKPL